jgi:hypothetical protein
MKVIISNVFGKASRRPIHAVDALEPGIAYALYLEDHR